MNILSQVNFSDLSLHNQLAFFNFKATYLYFLQGG